jgi:hypothetical protein
MQPAEPAKDAPHAYPYPLVPVTPPPTAFWKKPAFTTSLGLGLVACSAPCPACSLHASMQTSRGLHAGRTHAAHFVSRHF